MYAQDMQPHLISSQWTKSILGIISKKENANNCSNHRLISHASKITLRIKSNHCCQKKFQPQRTVRKDDRKPERSPFHRLQKGVRQNLAMMKSNIDNGIMKTIEALYQDSKIAVLIGITLSEWSTTKVGIRH